MRNVWFSLLIIGIVFTGAGFAEKNVAAAGIEYGETRTVDISTTVPDNWVVTMMSYSLKKKEITYVGGAQYKDQIRVHITSPVPDGWIVLSRNDSSDTKTIEYLG